MPSWTLAAALATAAVSAVARAGPVPSLLDSGAAASVVTPAEQAVATNSFPLLVYNVDPVLGTFISADPSSYGTASSAPSPVVDGSASANSAPSLLSPAAAGTANTLGGSLTGSIKLALPDSTVVPSDLFMFTGYDVRPRQDAGLFGSAGPTGFSSQTAFDMASLQAPGTVGQASDGIKSRIVTKVVQSDQDLQEVTQVTADVAGSGWGFSAQAKFGYSSAQETKSSVVLGVSYAIMSLPGRMIQNPGNVKLTAEAQGYLASGDVDTFMELFGTHFIKTRGYGCEMQASFTFTCQSVSAKTELAASLQAGYSGGLFSGAATVATNAQKYGAAGVCTYDGQWTGEGVDSLNPSKAQMLNDRAVNDAFNKFGQACRDSFAAGNAPLAYVVLGNWWELPAVREAVTASGSKAAMDTLRFYAQMQQPDVEALIQADTYSSKARQAVAYTRPECMSPAWSKGPFVARKSGSGDASDGVIPADYWQSLPERHTQLAARAQAITFSAYLGTSAISDAMQKGIPMSSQVQAYLAAAKVLYADAKTAYRYTWCNARGIFTSVGDVTGKVELSLPAAGPANFTHTQTNLYSQSGASMYVSAALTYKPEYDRDGNPLGTSLVFGVTTKQSKYSDFYGIMAGPQAMGYSNPSSSDVGGPTGAPQATGLSAEIFMEWTMPDISYEPASPYGADY